MATSTTDFTADREHMVERQLRRRGISEQIILDAQIAGVFVGGERVVRHLDPHKAIQHRRQITTSRASRSAAGSTSASSTARSTRCRPTWSVSNRQ